VIVTSSGRVDDVVQCARNHFLNYNNVLSM
jgi:hypothetical protein